MDEFTVYLIGDLVISAIVAAFTYGFGPVTVAIFFGRPIQKKKFKIFCIIYTIVVWFAWQMYRESSGNGVSIVPAILWGYVSYLIAKKIMNKKYYGQCKSAQKTAELELEQQNALPEPEEAKSEQPVGQPAKEPEIQRWYTCPKCGQLVKDGEECDCEEIKLALEEEKKKKEEQKQQKRQALKKAMPLYTVCALLLVSVCALVFYSYNLKEQVDELLEKNIELNSKVSELVKKNEELAELNKNISSKSGSSLKKIIFYVADSKNKKYHVPSCSLVKNISQEDRIDLSNYITLLIQKENGYTPCSQCDPDNYTPGQQASDDYTRHYLEEKFRQGID